MDTSETLIDLREVSVRAGAVKILQDVNLEITNGQAVAVFGPNGAGKTTLLRLMATLLQPSAGEATVLGASLASEDRYDVRPHIGFIGHLSSLYPELTLQENLEFVADARGIDRSSAGAALTSVGLAGSATRLADHCSHGMQRRAEFARIIMTEPRLLLLDEPHSALDADAVELVDAIVERTVDLGGAAVLVSHDRDRVRRITDRSVEIRSGTLS